MSLLRVMKTDIGWGIHTSDPKVVHHWKYDSGIRTLGSTCGRSWFSKEIGLASVLLRRPGSNISQCQACLKVCNEAE